MQIESEITTAVEIYSVSELNREIRALLEDNFPLIWVEGEISNFKHHSSGHMYFSLKDAAAQVRCAMFRGRNNKLSFAPKDGTQVLVQAQISLYEGRGDFQLIIEHMEEAGDGALRRAFENLKNRLAQEGLFDAAHKKTFPPFPNCIGIVTSPTGAAIRDILNVLRRRAPHVAIVIYPTAVQGSEAAPQIVNAVQIANQRQECDILIVARGGGSLEDLWPFNEEIVARAIFASQIPIVSGVGHEVDFTIADFVADHRAPTPSAAAEVVSPNCSDWLHKLELFQGRLRQLITAELRHLNTHFNGVIKLLQHPKRKLQDQAQHLDYLENNLQNALWNVFHTKHTQLNQLLIQFHQQAPQQRLQHFQSLQKNLLQRLNIAIQNNLHYQEQRLVNLSRALAAVSPLNTLSRGYAIVTHDDQSVIYAASQVKIGEKIQTKLGKGSLACTVNEILKD